MRVADRHFYLFSNFVSTKKLRKSNMERLAHEQAHRIVKECLTKKFADNAAQMESWLSGVNRTGLQVSRWATDVQVPGWVLMRILVDYADLRAFAFEQREVKHVDPDVETLRQRIDTLLKDEFLRKHFEVEAGICESFLREGLQAEIAAQIVQKSKELTAHQKDLLLKELQRDALARGPQILRRAQNHSSHDEPGEPAETPPRSPGADSKGKNPRRKK
jgi:hypothetical protein